MDIFERISPGVNVTPLAYDEFAAAGEGYQKMIDTSAAERTGTSDKIAEAGAFLRRCQLVRTCGGRRTLFSASFAGRKESQSQKEWTRGRAHLSSILHLLAAARLIYNCVEEIIPQCLPLLTLHRFLRLFICVTENRKGQMRRWHKLSHSAGILLRFMECNKAGRL